MSLRPIRNLETCNSEFTPPCVALADFAMVPRQLPSRRQCRAGRRAAVRRRRCARDKPAFLERQIGRHTADDIELGIGQRNHALLLRSLFQGWLGSNGMPLMSQPL